MEIALTCTQTQLMMRMSDNGTGGAGPNRIGYGIAGLYERAESLGACLSIATDATGTTVELIITTL